MRINTGLHSAEKDLSRKNSFESIQRGSSSSTPTMKGEMSTKNDGRYVTHPKDIQIADCSLKTDAVVLSLFRRAAAIL